MQPNEENRTWNYFLEILIIQTLRRGETEQQQQQQQKNQKHTLFANFAPLFALDYFYFHFIRAKRRRKQE